MTSSTRWTGITRTRTGCLTCRRRRKKCDERKPACNSCERNRLICEGYENRVTWVANGRVSSRRKRADTGMDEPVSPACASPVIDNTPAGPSAETQENASGQSITFTFPDWDSTETFAPEVSWPVTSTELSLVDNSVDSFWLEDDWTNQLPPRPLPPLIDGIQTSMERRLFHHFISSIGPTLVIHGPNSGDAFTDTILEYAITDPTSMKTVLGVAASHLAQGMERNNPVNPGDLRNIRQAGLQFYHEAILSHQRRINDILSTASQQSLHDWNAAFAATMLLTQYDTCEGGTCGIWQTHLRIARQLVTQNSSIFGQQQPNVLLDWFFYHDVLARFSETIAPKDDYSPGHCLALALQPDSVISESILIGPRDGLFDLLNRIVDLEHRSRQETLVSSQKTRLLVEGLRISNDLNNWTCPYFSEQSRIVAECYRWAAFLILYSTIHKSTLGDEKIQAILIGGLEWVERLSHTDTAQTCSLFPLFALGIATQEATQRQLVTSKMSNYGAWAGLGNIAATRDFLHQWWARLDDRCGESNWWDWQAVALEEGITVTLV
ncbi:hypothetical protein K491DRAFT_673337 [Lophiostoma macrostomum CBS 122681]|uniref:Zn(2)-C6 fungal-type domain-containing protein n=1 Tax=Lophiostoma macrostomum CBS 122681 TaxID=1314788 RepID=A0A6A6TSH4_9PLEO|nr:hypothetical protein K491DRAFT_673337 [Lophiostoma macrostomum CBS 122681]